MLILFLQTVTDKVSQGIADIFARLYEEFMPKVYQYISYRIVDSNVVEDITSTVFEKALTNINKYDSDKASFSTWIFSIARNTLIDHYRLSTKEKTRQMNMVSLGLDNDSGCPEEELIRNEEIKTLKSCISQLSSQEQEIISLKFGGEMTNRQIAKILGLSETNVGVIIYRTVRKLRDKFKDAER